MLLPTDITAGVPSSVCTLAQVLEAQISSWLELISPLPENLRLHRSSARPLRAGTRPPLCGPRVQAHAGRVELLFADGNLGACRLSSLSLHFLACQTGAMLLLSTQCHLGVT